MGLFDLDYSNSFDSGAMASAVGYSSADSAASSLSSLLNSGAAFLGSAASTYMSYQRQAADIAAQKAGIELNSTLANARIDLAKANANNAIAAARAGYSVPWYNFDQSMANLGTVAGNSQNQMMLWLAAAGVLVAVVSFVKGK